MERLSHIIPKTILKKNRVEGISLPDIKTYTATVITTVVLVVMAPRSVGENICKPHI